MCDCMYSMQLNGGRWQLLHGRCLMPPDSDVFLVLGRTAASCSTVPATTWAHAHGGLPPAATRNCPKPETSGLTLASGQPLTSAKDFCDVSGSSSCQNAKPRIMSARTLCFQVQSSQLQDAPPSTLSSYGSRAALAFSSTQLQGVAHLLVFLWRKGAGPASVAAVRGDARQPAPGGATQRLQQHCLKYLAESGCRPLAVYHQHDDAEESIPQWTFNDSNQLQRGTLCSCCKV
jgi:hypothetical protein